MALTPATLALKIALGLLPILLFLLVLVFLDSYKLVRFKTLAAALAGGLAAAAASYVLNSGLLAVLRSDFAVFSRYGAPLVEESLKAAALLLFFRSRKVGFLVDAAILGFAVGAGFSLAENAVYLGSTAGSGFAVWAVRGVGTAMMHGGTTAVFAVVTKVRLERRDRPRRVEWLPGLGLAALLHSAFNQFILPPLAATAVLLVVFPLLSVFVFILGEKRTRKWLDVGFDSDVELLGLIGEGRFSSSKIGSYLLSLKHRFPPEAVADMFCLIRIRVELAVAAKGRLLLAEAGMPVKPDPSLRAKFRELDYLEKNIGPTGMLALAPIFHDSRRDLWQAHILGR